MAKAQLLFELHDYPIVQRDFIQQAADQVGRYVLVIWVCGASMLSMKSAASQPIELSLKLRPFGPGPPQKFFKSFLGSDHGAPWRCTAHIDTTLDGAHGRRSRDTLAG